MTWQAAAFGAVVARADEHVPRRPAHPRRGGDRTRRAAPRRAGRPARADHRAALLTAVARQRAARARWSPLSLVAYPLAVADSLALGVGLTLCGWVFTGTALIAAQLTASTRGGVRHRRGGDRASAYALRAVGDVGDPALCWLSPIGWYQAMHAVLRAALVAGLLLLVAAAVAVGGGLARLRPARPRRRAAGRPAPGPARARRGLRRPVGLAWRLQRAAVSGWTVGMFLGGVALRRPSATTSTSLVGDSQTAQDMFAPSGGTWSTASTPR